MRDGQGLSMERIRPGRGPNGRGRSVYPVVVVVVAVDIAAHVFRDRRGQERQCPLLGLQNRPVLHASIGMERKQ